MIDQAQLRRKVAELRGSGAAASKELRPLSLLRLSLLRFVDSKCPGKFPVDSLWTC